MSIRTDIEACIKAMDKGEDWITASLCFPADFSGFQGHFPQHPILPGMCLVETVLVLLARLKGLPVSMIELRMAKFFTAVLPDQDLAVDCRVQGDEVIARMERSGERVAQLKMRISNA